MHFPPPLSRRTIALVQGVGTKKKTHVIAHQHAVHKLQHPDPDQERHEGVYQFHALGRFGQVVAVEVLEDVLGRLRGGGRGGRLGWFGWDGRDGGVGGDLLLLLLLGDAFGRHGGL